MQRDTFPVESFPCLEGFSSAYRERTIRVCIATEGILGPVRNGGIASTYYHLARGLARQGHKVTVLYLRGRNVEEGTPEHWIEHFAGFGIELVCLELVEGPLLVDSDRWQRVYYSFYLWLKANDRFEVVHTSEWRGGAFYCLQAKRLDLAFQDVLFIVKTSSPHVWNRHYQMQPIEDPQLVTAAYAEQRCVEWADMVVGGSAHLLSFMRHIGYALPEGRTYAQPNIIDFSEVIVTDARPARAHGEQVRTREVVFFGRLEQRKGLEIFIDAVNALIARGIAPSRVTFLGKEGVRLINQDNLKPLEFIARQAAHWPFEVEIVTDLNQPEALSFMCRRDMIAVMPSLIENSSMAVYEALVHKIPFIATAVGGTPELVDRAYHRTSLIEPSGADLIRQLERALREGQPIAAPAFDNDRNLETWYAFHRFLAERGARALMAPRDEQAAPREGTDDPPISYIAYLSNPRDARGLVEHLREAAGAFQEMLLCLAFVPTREDRAALEAGAPANLEMIDALGATSGEAFNQVRERARGEILVFDAVGTLRFAPAFANHVRRALHSRPGAIVTTFVTFVDDPLDPDGAEAPPVTFLPMGGDLASHYASNTAFGVELIALRQALAHTIGPFEPYAFNAGIVHEFVTRAIAAGVDFEVVPEADLHYAGHAHPTNARSANYDYLKFKAPIDQAPLALKKVLLFHLSLKNGSARARGARRIVAKAGRQGDEIAWLTNPQTIRRPSDGGLAIGGAVAGFDPATGTVHFGLWGEGSLLLTANETELRRADRAGQPDAFWTLSLEALPLLEGTDQVWLRLALDNPDRQQRWTMAIQRLEDGVFFVGSRRPLFWDQDFDTVTAPILADGARQTAYLSLLDHARRYMQDGGEGSSRSAPRPKQRHAT